MPNAKFTSHRQPFKCAACGKTTTGPSGVLGATVCSRCYDAAGLENEHSDTRGTHYGDAAAQASCPLCQIINQNTTAANRSANTANEGANTMNANVTTTTDTATVADTLLTHAAEKANKSESPVDRAIRLQAEAKLKRAKKATPAEAEIVASGDDDAPKANKGKAGARKAKKAEPTAPAPAPTPAATPAPVELTPHQKATLAIKAKAEAAYNAIKDKVITVLVAENPKKVGSATRERFDRYKTGMTIDQALKAGITRDDLKWDQRHKFISY